MIKPRFFCKDGDFVSSLQKYPVTVLSDLTFAERVKTGKYERVNSNIVSCRFLHLGEPGEYTLEFVHLNMSVSTETVLAEFTCRRLVAGGIRQLLALGEKYPDLQRQFPIAALRSVWVRPHGFRFWPFLDQDGNDRVLNLQWNVYNWHENCRFLAYRKIG